MAHQNPIGNVNNVRPYLGEHAIPSLPENICGEKDDTKFDQDEVGDTLFQVKIHDGVVFGGNLFPVD